jgi:hypothetical protein
MDEREAFKLGADAMRSRVAAFLMAKNQFDLAPQVLTMQLPDFKIPEKITISNK